MRRYDEDDKDILVADDTIRKRAYSRCIQPIVKRKAGPRTIQIYEYEYVESKETEPIQALFHHVSYVTLHELGDSKRQNILESLKGRRTIN